MSEASKPTKKLDTARKANRKASEACKKAVDLTVAAMDAANAESEFGEPKTVVAFYWGDSIIVIARGDKRFKLGELLRRENIAHPQFPRPA